MYLAQKFARVAMGTNSVDVTSNLYPELTQGLLRALGPRGGRQIPFGDLEKAGSVLVFNSNLTEDNNVLALPIRRAAKNGASLIIIDSREVELTRHADMWLRPRPGTELLLLGGILREVLDQGLVKEQWVEENCEDPATLFYYLHNLDLDEVAATTQVSRNSMALAAGQFGGAESSAVCYGLNNVPSELQRDCVRRLVGPGPFDRQRGDGPGLAFTR